MPVWVKALKLNINILLTLLTTFISQGVSGNETEIKTHSANEWAIASVAEFRPEGRVFGTVDESEIFDVTDVKLDLRIGVGYLFLFSGPKLLTCDVIKGGDVAPFDFRINGQRIKGQLWCHDEFPYQIEHWIFNVNGKKREVVYSLQPLTKAGERYISSAFDSGRPVTLSMTHGFNLEHNFGERFFGQFTYPAKSFPEVLLDLLKQKELDKPL